MGGLIPDDVRKAAKSACGEWNLIVAVARAILAERQRCADVAKQEAEDSYGDTSAIGAAATIRHRILSPVKT